MARSAAVTHAPSAIREVLEAITHYRPDLRLHGFGIKKTALADHAIRALLYSADSQAGGLWDGITGKERKYQYSNSVAHMEAYRQSILSTPIQLNLFVTNRPIQSQILTVATNLVKATDKLD